MMKRKLYKLNDHGAALIAGLLILVVLSILGITTMQSSLLQERMAGNMEQRDVAFQRAEAALREAEAWLGTQIAGASLPAFNNTNGLYQLPAAGDPPRWQSIDWNNVNHYRVYGTNDAFVILPLVERPRYIIEFVTIIANPDSESLAVDDVPDNFGMYRISSRGLSPNERAAVILQTTFLR